MQSLPFLWSLCQHIIVWRAYISLPRCLRCCVFACLLLPLLFQLVGSSPRLLALTSTEEWTFWTCSRRTTSSPPGWKGGPVSGVLAASPGRSSCGAAQGSSAFLGPTATLPVPGRRFCRPLRSPPPGPSARDRSRARRLTSCLPGFCSCGPASLPPPALGAALHLLAPPAPLSHASDLRA